MKAVCGFMLVLACTCQAAAQNKFFLTLNPGESLYNSENSLPTIGEKSFRWTPGFSVGYERDSVWGFGARVEYSYTRSLAASTLQFTVTGPAEPFGLAYYHADMAFSTHNLDIALCYRPVEIIAIALGPTMSLVQRAITFTVPSTPGAPGRFFEDRLVSYCLGGNGSVNLEIPLERGSQYIFLLANLKLRYLHSVWFDKRGRNLDNYHQSSLLGDIGIGAGYGF